MTISKREANKKQCRHNILKASRRLFKEEGYEATMIEDVAEKADISKATLYNYFPNKESLLTGTMDEEIETFRNLVKEDNGLSSLEKIRESMKFLIIDSIPFISVSRKILYLNACDTSPMYGKANEVREILIEMADRAKEEGDLNEEISNEEFTDLLMGIYLTSQFQWSDIEMISQQECRERIDRTFDLMTKGCCNK